MGNISIVQGARADGIMASNETVAEQDLIIDVGFSAVVAGPTKIPNVTVNGNLNAVTELEVTGTLTIGANGQLNIIG